LTIHLVDVSIKSVKRNDGYITMAFASNDPMLLAKLFWHEQLSV